MSQNSKRSHVNQPLPFGVNFYPRDVVSTVYATATWLAGWVGRWLGVCHMPVLYQNGWNLS